MLLMTATPIPRSLAMTLYGDLDVSIMRGMPKGRKPIETARFMERERDAVWTRIAAELEKGHQAYVVYPLVEESEAMDLRDAMSAVATLKEAFPRYCVDVLHGRMTSAEKEDVMGRFSRGDIQVLVSTTVIEVGVDVPNATVMAIEHAERFGLSQLHQLRGRVGRGGDQGYCFLISGHAISAEGKARLAAMCQTTDGFKIAEMDLKLRGAGDFFGTRQSGLPAFKLADLVRDAEWIGIARQAALALADRDLRLVDPSHQVLKTWLSPTVRDRSGFIRVG
jgi:ATP-dependent DNA helicase RecG